VRWAGGLGSRAERAMAAPHDNRMDAFWFMDAGSVWERIGGFCEPERTGEFR